MTSDLLLYFLAYLIGGIPFGYLITKLQGIDVRDHGSGNIGATNVARVGGKKSGVITLLADALKGAACPALAFLLSSNPDAPALMGVIGILGHCFSPYLKLKGGKGVATSLGVFAVLTPVSALVAVGAFVLVFYFSRTVSLASIAGSIVVPISYYILQSAQLTNSILIAAVATAIIIVMRHKENIERLTSGGELKL